MIFFYSVQAKFLFATFYVYHLIFNYFFLFQLYFKEHAFLNSFSINNSHTVKQFVFLSQLHMSNLEFYSRSAEIYRFNGKKFFFLKLVRLTGTVQPKRIPVSSFTHPRVI